MSICLCLSSYTFNTFFSFRIFFSKECGKIQSLCFLKDISKTVSKISFWKRDIFTPCNLQYKHNVLKPCSSIPMHRVWHPQLNLLWQLTAKLKVELWTWVTNMVMGIRDMGKRVFEIFFFNFQFSTLWIANNRSFLFMISKWHLQYFEIKIWQSRTI